MFEAATDPRSARFVDPHTLLSITMGQGKPESGRGSEAGKIHPRDVDTVQLPVPTATGKPTDAGAESDPNPVPEPLDYVDSGLIPTRATHWYRDAAPGDQERVRLAVATHDQPDGRLHLVVRRGNGWDEVEDVMVQMYGLGCCWPISEDPRTPDRVKARLKKP